MFSFFRKKHIKFYNSIPGLSDNFPITNIKDFKYQWKKSAQPSKCPIKDFSVCPGINYLVSKGFLLHNFVDIKFNKIIQDNNDFFKFFL